MSSQKNKHKVKSAPQRTVHSNITLAVLALIVLLFLLLLGQIVTFFTNYTLPLKADYGGFVRSSWNGKSAVNVVVASTEGDKPSINILSYDPQEKRVTILSVSDQIYMDLPKGYGSWRVSSVYNLGQEENPPKGAALLKLSISKLVGLPIDGIIIKKGDDQTKFSDKIYSFRKNPLSILSFLKGAHSDLTLAESVRIFWDVSKIREDQIQVLDLAQSTITESRLLADSTRVLGVDTIQMDIFIRNKMADSVIFDEGVSVTVLNATSHPGMAQDASRIITNMGANVVSVSTTETNQESSQVIFKRESEENVDSLTYDRLRSFFAPKCMKSECLNGDPKVKTARSQIVVVLGEDYYLRYYGK